jgi:hypothetical protein
MNDDELLSSNTLSRKNKHDLRFNCSAAALLRRRLLLTVAEVLVRLLVWVSLSKFLGRGGVDVFDIHKTESS